SPRGAIWDRRGSRRGTVIPFMSGAVRRVITACCSCANEMCMQQMIKRFLWVGGLALGLQTAWGFALLGPNTALPGYNNLGPSGDPWQTIAIGYDMVDYYGIA